MAQIKRQKIESSSLTRDQPYDFFEKINLSHFEDLSNELIYEIFEYLDYFHVYQAFLNLNQRYAILLNSSNFPIKINFSSMPKSTVKRFNEDIIKSNTHRIVSLRVSEVFMYDFVFSSTPKLTQFQRLETVILNNIEAKYLENLLNELRSLTRVSTLVISSIDTVTNKSLIYQQIFRLPTLQYCKLSLSEWGSEGSLPICVNEYSSIKHLIIVNSICFDQLVRLLSYVPHLRRLSLHRLQKSWNDREQMNQNLLNYLTHLSLKISYVKFDALAQLIMNFFQNIEALHLTIQEYDIDEAYIDANRWQQFILSYLTNLRVFNIHFDLSKRAAADQFQIETQINQFTSSFWIERQWFFTHHLVQTPSNERLIFYSTNPYRRKHYTLYKGTNKTNSLDEYGSHLNAVEYVHIESGECMFGCQHHFPNAIEIIFERGFTVANTSIIPVLDSIMSLKQLTKLVIKCPHFSVQRLIKVLCHTFNIHTLELKSMPCYKQKNDYLSIQQSQDFQLVSTGNSIKNITCDAACKLEQIKLLTALCPRLECLTINRRVNDIESIIHFLLDKTNPNTHHLCFIGFTRAWGNWPNRLEQLINSEVLLNDYTLKSIGWNLYLWW